MNMHQPYNYAAHMPVASWPPLLVPVSVLLLITCAFGPNLALGVAAVLALLVGGKLLWRPGEAPSLLFVFVSQWVQAAVAIFDANLQDLPLSDVLRTYSSSADTATAQSLAGLVLLAVGMRLGAGAPMPQLAREARAETNLQSPFGWIVFYGVTWAVCAFAQGIAYVWPGLSQPLITLAQFKWAAFIAFTIAMFGPRGNRRLWLAVFAVEFALSVGGFFSNFKDVFLYALIGLAAAGVRVSARQLAAGAVLSAALVALAIVWTAIKGDYRAYLNSNDTVQTVDVSLTDRWDKLAELVGQIDGHQLAEATDNLVKRLAYVEFFGAVLEMVPHHIPHEGGALWIDAVTRPFMPRLFFPEKSALDDSEMTRKYTGINVAGTEQGTSISIGYMGESYVDFGAFGMMVPIFALGLYLGWLHRWLVSNARIGPLFGTSLAAAVLITASHLETTAAKTFGGLAISLVVAWLLVSFVLPRYLRWVGGRARRA